MTTVGFTSPLCFRGENRSMEMMDGKGVKPSAHHSSNGKYGLHRQGKTLTVCGVHRIPRL